MFIHIGYVLKFMLYFDSIVNICFKINATILVKVKVSIRILFDTYLIDYKILQKTNINIKDKI